MLCNSFTRQELPTSYQSTVAVDFFNRIVEKDFNYNINLWDFSGDF